MKSKQTAVEWLIDYIKNLETYPYKTFQELNQQALAMEKEQIMDAYNNGDNRSAELYYEETYEK